MSRVFDMHMVGRSNDHFEAKYAELDQLSFQEFIDQANDKDNRIVLMENWLTRKEQEIFSRVNPVNDTDLAQSDAAIFKQLDAPLKAAREKMVSQMLTVDEAGNPIPQKQYSQMTTSELHIIAENLSVRLNAFYQQPKTPSERYPAFMPQVVKAVMEHPNLANSDRNLLETYCSIFDLDWRGDQTIKSQEQFLCTNPIYMDAQA